MIKLGLTKWAVRHFDPARMWSIKNESGQTGLPNRNGSIITTHPIFDRLMDET